MWTLFFVVLCEILKVFQFATGILWIGVSCKKESFRSCLFRIFYLLIIFWFRFVSVVFRLFRFVCALSCFVSMSIFYVAIFQQHLHIEYISLFELIRYSMKKIGKTSTTTHDLNKKRVIPILQLMDTCFDIHAKYQLHCI
jgi:hypothetical protein